MELRARAARSKFAPDKHITRVFSILLQSTDLHRFLLKPNILAIAGSDSSGGAGIQADLKTIAAHGMVGLSCVTVVTAQSDKELLASHNTPVDLMRTQLEVLLDTYPIASVKSGLLPNRSCVHVVRKSIETNRPKAFVMDPVLASSSGFRLVEEDLVDALIEDLFPLTTLVTPNKHEAELLTGVEIRSEANAHAAAKSLVGMGCSNVLMKGGHFDFSPGVDMLLQSTDIGAPIRIAGEFFLDRSVRGTGCTYATAIACELARTDDLEDAVRKAKRYLTATIRNAYEVAPGHWIPDHFADFG